MVVAGAHVVVAVVVEGAAPAALPVDAPHQTWVSMEEGHGSAAGQEGGRRGRWAAVDWSQPHRSGWAGLKVLQTSGRDAPAAPADVHDDVLSPLFEPPAAAVPGGGPDGGEGGGEDSGLDARKQQEEVDLGPGGKVSSSDSGEECYDPEGDVKGSGPEWDGECCGSGGNESSCVLNVVVEGCCCCCETE